MNAYRAREPLDWTPRSVRLRLWIPGVKTPGKTIMAMLGAGGETNVSTRDDQLEAVYDRECSYILHFTAVALNEIRLRDIESRPVLSDAKEVLQFRCRVSQIDLTADQKAIAVKNLSAGNFPEGVDPSRPDSVVIYAIEVLGALADRTENKAVTDRCLRQLRDLIREAGKVAALAEYNPDKALVSFETAAHMAELTFGDKFFPDSWEELK